MKTIFAKLIAALILAILAPGFGVQADEIETGFRKLAPAEEQRFRAILAVPVPQGALFEALRRHFFEKDDAAVRLGDSDARIAVLREAIRFLPDPVFKSNLARELLGRGQFDEGNALLQNAIANADPFSKVFWSAAAACDLLNQNQITKAMIAMDDLPNQAKAAERMASQDWQKGVIARGLARNGGCKSSLQVQRGRYQEAAATADEVEKHARKALELIKDPSAQIYLQSDLSDAMLRKLATASMAGRSGDAENTFKEYLRFSREVQLPPAHLSSIYAAAGGLRTSQGEHPYAEQMFRKADSFQEQGGLNAAHRARVFLIRDIAISLVLQNRWPEALAEFDRMDSAAGSDIQAKSNVLNRIDRGFIYLGNRKYSEAAKLFEETARLNTAAYGEGHFFVGQARGLLGAALWRAGVAESRVKAVSLLKEAVGIFMQPASGEFLEAMAIRKLHRDFIFTAYLEAIASTPGEDATLALGAADWVRGGAVQEALGDAAVRAAASTPALADVVRREQDAKNEVTGIRRYLAGEAGAARSPLPQIAAQMRERIAVLEGERVKLQAQIKAQFPDYERLVRPTPPTVQDIARQLDPQQALLMLLPTADAVYVWAVASDRPAAFVRANLTETQVNALVSRLRHQLDFAFGSNVGSRFDSAVAFELYDKLLAPLAPVWQGKTQLVVAAGGSLSQLPFGVLQTRPPATGDENGFTANVPWLIREAAIAQVPSLSAWLAIKSISKGKPATQAFAAWGDPTFSTKLASNPIPSPTSSRSIALTRASTLADLEAPEKVANASALKYADIPPLPDTRDELLAIAASLQANASRDVLLGANATRDSVLAASKSGLLANKRVIAFATHGLMAGDLPNLNQPALALAATGAEGQNPLAPLLTLEDVLTLKLNADWVVLSACNTAAADGKADEALSGLARGFFYADSRSLLVTHWAVESESAKLLTTHTFAHYTANPQAPKAESLRQAMLKVMALPQYAHPAFWAPYALVGDGGR